MRRLHQYTDKLTGKLMPLIADDVMQIIEENAELLLDSSINFTTEILALIISVLNFGKSYPLKDRW